MTHAPANRYFRKPYRLYDKKRFRNRRPLILLALIVFLLAHPVYGFVTIEYFHQSDCLNCIRTDPIINDIRERYGDRVSVRDISIDTREAIRLLMSYGRTEIPVVVINHVKVLDGAEITEERLAEEIQLAEAGAYAGNATTGSKDPSSDSGYLSVIFSYFLGIMTGLSPCLLGSLVVMIAAAANTAGSLFTRRLYAPVFGAGIVTTYLIVAAGVLLAGFRLSTGSGFSTTVYTIAGLVTIGFGLLQLGLIRLPEAGEARTMRLFSRFKNLPGAFVLGLFFAIILSPCAGAPFLILVETLLFAGSVSAFAMLVAFGAGIMTPFLIIGIVFGSIPNERLIRFSSLIQKASGILLIVFGLWLLMEII
jgi:cytochrome c-type biogenesis protein